MVLDGLYSEEEKEILERRGRHRIRKNGLVAAPIDMSDSEDESQEEKEGDEEQKKSVALDEKVVSLLFSCLFELCGVALCLYIQSQNVERHEYIAGMVFAFALLVIGIVSFAWYYICWMDIEDFESQVKFAGEQMEMNKMNKKLRKSSSTVHGDGKETPLFHNGDGEIAVGDDGEEYDTSDICTSETTDNEDELSEDDSEMRGAISFPSENHMMGDLAGGTEIEMAEVGEQNTYERPNKKRGPNSP